MENKKIKLWKKILIVIGIIVLIFVIRIARNMVIIETLVKKASNYENITNFHITQYVYQGSTLNVSEYYVKDGKSLSEMNALKKGMNNKIILCNNGTATNQYVEAGENKVAYLNTQTGLGFTIVPNIMKTSSTWQLITMSATASIKSEVCDGKECYKIGSLLPTSIVMYENEEEYRALRKVDFSVYIEKETGLVLRKLEGMVQSYDDMSGSINMVTDLKYEFNTVTDENLKEPDISEYQVQENTNE